MRNKVLMATLTIVMLIATACGGGQAAAPTTVPVQTQEQPVSGTNSLDGTSWMLTTLNGQPALKDSTVTLNFEAGKVAGNDGCNRYSGTYTASGNTIKFGPLATTMMACAEPIMQQAGTYQQALGQAATFKADAKQLTLYDASGKELTVFNAQSTGLAGTAWIVTGYNNGKQAVVSVMNGTELTANFGADGQLSGSAGCNNYTASYQTDGSTITIGPAASTKKACEQAVMDQEQQYLAALSTAATYRIDGNQLELRTAAGALAATFTRAAASSKALPGSAWIVVGYNNGKQAVVSTMAGTDLTANFGADGTLTGNGGCNQYTATYKVEGNQISIGPAATTRKACDQAIMDQEQQYLAALATAATYRLDGSRLELRTADGALAADFSRVSQ